ncbi:MAG: hypothetical protein RLY70_1234 [Planctomycetota bacterium]
MGGVGLASRRREDGSRGFERGCHVTCGKFSTEFTSHSRSAFGPRLANASASFAKQSVASWVVVASLAAAATFIDQAAFSSRLMADDAATVSAKTTGTEKTGADKAGTEKTGIEKAGNEKTGIEKAGTEKAGTEKTGTEKTGTEKAGTEKASGEKTGQALSQQLQAAARQVANSQSHTFAYRAKAGETLRWKVTHLVTVDTKIRGSEQSAKTRSSSTKSWRVTAVDDEGNITFVYMVDDVDMWQSVTGRQEIRYNSRTDSQPPREYEVAAKSVGVPLATVVIDRFGRVVKRDSEQSQFNPGLGELTIPFPEKEMKVGARWNVPDEIRIRLEDGRVQRVQTRQSYTLEKVETGVATIGIKTEVLTPIDDPKVHAQLVQRLTQGSVKFDLDAGRLISRQMDLDETVIGFSGPDSVMQYLARLTDELQPASAAVAER